MVPALHRFLTKVCVGVCEPEGIPEVVVHELPVCLRAKLAYIESRFIVPGIVVAVTERETSGLNPFPGVLKLFRGLESQYRGNTNKLLFKFVVYRVELFDLCVPYSFPGGSA